MATTARGLHVTGDADAAAAIDRFTDLLARIRPGVEDVLADADRYPDVPLIQTSAAMLWLYAQTDDAQASARTYLDRAVALEATMDERERALLAACELWWSKRFDAAANALESLTNRWPTDIAAVKALEFLYYICGQQHSGPRFLAHLDSISAPNRTDPDFLAAWAFAHELTGRIDRAIELVDETAAIDPDVPWADHALAHALITRGDGPDVLARLAPKLSSWQAAGRVIHCHNAWHLALVHLDLLDDAAARALFGDHVWAVVPDSPGEQIDAISLLWRIEMGGWSVDDATWADVADHVEARVEECFMPFLSAHHAYCLARADRHDALDALLRTVTARTDATDDEARRVWQPVGRAVVEASAAHGRGDAVTCATALDGLLSAMPAVGGSDAQDDLFRQAYLTALRDAGRAADARTYWHAMTDWKTPSELELRWFATL